jgi:hypothetical protein
MKKKILTTIMCLFSLVVFSQTTTQTEVWTKEDRTNLFNDCINYTAKYKNLSNEQRESISLCYLGVITKKYTKTDLDNMIDIEIKRMKDAVIIECAKNLGVDLNVETKKVEVVLNQEKEENKSIPTKKNLIGKWKTDENSIIEFKEDGSYVKTYLFNYELDGWHVKDNMVYGDWFLDDSGLLKLTLNWTEEKFKDRKYSNPLGEMYHFISFSDDYIKYELTGNGVSSKIIQANKIKDQ